MSFYLAICPNRHFFLSNGITVRQNLDYGTTLKLENNCPECVSACKTTPDWRRQEIKLPENITAKNSDLTIFTCNIFCGKSVKYGYIAAVAKKFENDSLMKLLYSYGFSLSYTVGGSEYSSAYDGGFVEFSNENNELALFRVNSKTQSTKLLFISKDAGKIKAIGDLVKRIAASIKASTPKKIKTKIMPN